MSKGILTMALGKPIYGEFAAMFAASVKVKSPDTKLALIYEQSAVATLTSSHLALFDYMVLVDKSIHFNGREYVLAKLNIYELSPFDYTLFVDSDSFWTGEITPEDAIDKLMVYDFMPMVYGLTNMETMAKNKHAYTYWCNTNELKQVLGIKSGNLYCTSSTFIWFKRDSKKVESIFNYARRLKNTDGLPIQLIHGQKPDEFFFNTAMCLADVVLPKNYFVPVYFDHTCGLQRPEKIEKDYWLMTPAGTPKTQTIQYYNKEVKRVCSLMKIPPFFFRNKLTKHKAGSTAVKYEKA